jgi:transposase
MVKLGVALHERYGTAGLRKKFEHYDAAFRLRALKKMWKNQWSYAGTAIAMGIRSAGCLAIASDCVS